MDAANYEVSTDGDDYDGTAERLPRLNWCPRPCWTLRKSARRIDDGREVVLIGVAVDPSVRELGAAAVCPDLNSRPPD
jgi:hypothetical protein